MISPYNIAAATTDGRSVSWVEWFSHVQEPWASYLEACIEQGTEGGLMGSWKEWKGHLRKLHKPALRHAEEYRALIEPWYASRNFTIPEAYESWCNVRDRLWYKATYAGTYDAEVATALCTAFHDPWAANFLDPAHSHPMFKFAHDGELSGKICNSWAMEKGPIVCAPFAFSEQLRHTDVPSGVKLGDLKAPYPSMLLLLDKHSYLVGSEVLESWDQEVGHCFQTPEGASIWGVLLTFCTPHLSQEHEETGVPHPLLPVRMLPHVSQYVRGEDDLLMLRMSFFLSDGSAFTQLFGCDVMDTPIDNLLRSGMEDWALPSVEWIFKLLLHYLAEPESWSSARPRRGKAITLQGKKTRVEEWDPVILGASDTFPASITDEDLLGPVLPSGRARPRVHWRRGHFRRLPSHRLVWVRPVLVNKHLLKMPGEEAT